MTRDELTDEQREYIGTIPNKRHATLEAYLKDLRQESEQQSMFPQEHKSRAYDQ